MPAPTNISFATATDLGTTLPVTVTQQVDDAGTTYTVYYKYTAQSGDPPVIGIFAFGDLTVYKPLTNIWIGPLGSETQYLPSTVVNKPFQMLVTPGQTYFIKCQPLGLNPAPANLTINVQRFPQTSYPVGSIGVNDDTGGFPIAVLSAITALPLFFTPLNGASETAAITTSGILALGNENVVPGKEVFYFNSALQLIATITLPIRTRGITTDMSSRFYMNQFGTGTVYAYDLSGNQIRSWTLPDTDNVNQAVTHTNTILYTSTNGINQPIRRFDLVNNVALTDLVAGVALYNITRSGMLCLADGTILAAYIHQTPGADAFVRQYSAAGATLHTYTLGDSNGDVRMAMAVDDPASFWVWTKDVAGGSATGFSTFRNIRISDGATLVSINAPEYEEGAYVPAPTATPVRFGHSESCSFWITRGGPAPPMFHTTTQIIRRQRTAPHLSNEQGWVYYPKIQLDFQSGVGLVTGQGSSPVVWLEWSDDGGHTWSNQHTLSIGVLGSYRFRTILRRMGRSRDRVYRVTTSDPVATNLIAAYLDVEPGTS